ncbi:MAG: 2OG-Fe(II) oxygenase, partial [Bdellovibrionota bacterium]
MASSFKDTIIVDGFANEAKDLKKFFDLQFENPRAAQAKRFVWDYWYVPEQYKLLRTPAYHYFPPKVYNSFHRSLVEWGRRELGCHDISPPWLSYYVEGCEQKLHADVPHGPWAFVYSLTVNPKKFQGGETQILRRSVLDYWNTFQETDGEREFGQFFDLVPSKFNRLVVFDPRLPHGVRRVSGVEDPKQARIVIHGWFVEPRPYVIGSLTTAQVGKTLQSFMDDLSENLEKWPLIHGVYTCRLQITAAGKVKSTQILSNTMTVVADRQQLG